MAIPTSTKRIVYHIGGYDPITPQDAVHFRFNRELQRFKRAWSAKCSVSGVQFTEDEMRWHIVTEGPNWRVETDYHLVRWDDVIKNFGRRPIWKRIPQGVLSFFDFVLAGALGGYFRTNWHYAVFFLYPFLVFAAFAAIALIVSTMVAENTSSLVAGMWSGAVAFTLFFWGPWRWLRLAPLFDDWIFSCAYVHDGDHGLERKLARIASTIVAAPQRGADEILFVGHSLGAVLAIDLIDRVLTLSPRFGQAGPRVTFLSVGSSILKIGLHRRARTFRAAVQRVASASGVFWGDFQARVDIMNFYNTEPIAEMRLTAKRRPAVRLVEIGQMLEHATYRKMRLRFFRLHCQFISGNDRRAPYDYFMLVCGPCSAERQTLSIDGAMSMIGEDGSLNSLEEQSRSVLGG